MNLGSELEKLNDLRIKGVLTEAEFSVAKSKLLGQSLTEGTVHSGEYLMDTKGSKPAKINQSIMLAPMGKRFSAIFIDGAFAFLVGYSLMMLTSSLITTDGLLPLLLMYGFIIIYGFFADGMFDGQSVGKKLMKLRVVGFETDEPGSYMQSFLRNITGFLWIFDYVPLLKGDKRRVGDYLAKTKVVMVV